MVFAAFMGGLQPSRFLFSLSMSLSNSLEKLMVKAQKHMNAEDARRGADKES